MNDASEAFVPLPFSLPSEVDAADSAHLVTPLRPARLRSSAAARYCGYAPKTFANMRALGRGPRFQRSGPKNGAVFYFVADLENWLSEQGLVGGGDAA